MVRQRPSRQSFDDAVSANPQRSRYNQNDHRHDQHYSHDFQHLDDDYYSANHEMDGISVSK